jgi:Transposase IS66 family
VCSYSGRLWRSAAAVRRRLPKSSHCDSDAPFSSGSGHEQPYLFTFLRCPGFLDATNNAAERALRPSVIARKTWGGNRTPAGAQNQQILASILRTCWNCHEFSSAFVPPIRPVSL